MRDRFYMNDTHGMVEVSSVSNSVLDRLKKNSFSEIIPNSRSRGINTGVVRVTNEEVENIAVKF